MQTLLVAAALAAAPDTTVVTAMRVHAARAEWEDVERLYATISRREPSVVALDLAAQSAQQRGDILTYRSRLLALQAVSPSDAYRSELASIEANYAEVDIRVSRRRPALLMPGFGARDTASYFFAWGELDRVGRFHGLLESGVECARGCTADALTAKTPVSCTRSRGWARARCGAAP